MPETETTTLPEMTGEQFAWHIQRVMYGLHRLRAIALPNLIERLDNASRTPDWTLLTDMGVVEAVANIAQYNLKLRELRSMANSAIATANTTVRDTADLFGSDWVDLAYTKQDAVQIAFRMGKLNATHIYRWYGEIVTALDLGHRALEADVDFRLAMAQAEENYWSRMNDLWQYPIRPFQALIGAAAAFAAAILDSAGQALHLLGDSALDAFLEALKGLAIPLIIVGGVVLGGPYVVQFARANWGKTKRDVVAKGAAEAIDDNLQGVRRPRRRLYR